MMLAKIRWIFVLLFLSLLFGCASGEDQSTPTTESVVTPAENPATTTEAPVLTAAELESLKAQYAAEAETEITAENAEQVAEELEREIDAELASEL
jgi:uncharacterized protein YcfL